jgi:4-hydroxybenzoate polyprenyltransferase
MPIPPETETSAQVQPRAAWFAGMCRALVVSMRPHQWTKNVLLFGGLIFSRSLFDLTALGTSLSAFAAFCLASSGGYLFNDLWDVANDRRHPVKRFRPIPSGRLNPAIAGVAIVVLLSAALLIGLAIRPRFAALLAAYIVLSFSYTLGLKRVVILDVILLALGFLLRAVAGAVALRVVGSSWLVLCTLVLAVYVALGKRRHELTLLESEAKAHRPSLEGYSEQLLDLMMAITGGAALLAYSLYTLSDATVLRFGGGQLVLTIPFVIYGIFRYLLLVHRRHEAEDPAGFLLTDWPSLVNVILWGILVCILIYAPVAWLVE